jgi:ubiquinone/menaquinone biosynthesis C-methylase UbiE
MMSTSKSREIRPSSDSDYRLAKYLTPSRMSSIGWQFALCEETGAQTFLEVGAGSGVLAFLLGRQGKRVITADPYPVVQPNVLAALPSLPLADQCVDASLCFQVLEHLPLDLFPTCLNELRRVSRRWVIVSLPDRTVKIGRKAWVRQIIYRVIRHPKHWRPRPIHPQHYWELGPKDVSYDTVVAAARQNGLTLVQQFTNRQNRYHRFFLFTRTEFPVNPS